MDKLTPEDREKLVEASFSSLRDVLLQAGFTDNEVRTTGARFFAEAGHRLPVQNTPSDPSESMRHRIIALCGPSGSGKTTLQNALLSAPNSDFVRVVGDTTRPPREGEVDGVDYHFISESLFAQRVADGEYLEHATVYGHRKGIRRAEFNRVTENHPNKAILMVLDQRGIENYSTSFEPGEFTAVFLVGPGKAGLERRMLERGDKPEDIAPKLADWASELNWAVSEPYVDFFLPDTSVTHGVALVTCLAAILPLARNDFLGRVTDDIRVKSSRG